MLNAARARALVAVLALAVAYLAPVAARAETDPEALVEKARLTFDSMFNDKNYTQLKRQLKFAKALLIMPSQLKAAFIVGAQGGSGLLIARNVDGSWGYPAFYTIGAGSVGLQIGFQNSEAVLEIMTDRGLNAVINNQVKLGVDASVAVGPVGEGISGSTTTAAGADIVTFSRTEGLFAGGSFEGAVIVKRDDWNTSYYGKGATPRAIVYEKKFSNPQADRLRQAIEAAYRESEAMPSATGTAPPAPAAQPSAGAPPAASEPAGAPAPGPQPVTSTPLAPPPK
ncbi:MAG TPA: lipid-binding SYLF domain-containing protein [Alphaproteobacteria bacterium]|nr:lipid-binding SYLF domain-containing protein [Alphaproteobacteria bacterium]